MINNPTRFQVCHFFLGLYGVYDTKNNFYITYGSESSYLIYFLDFEDISYLSFEDVNKLLMLHETACDLRNFIETRYDIDLTFSKCKKETIRPCPPEESYIVHYDNLIKELYEKEKTQKA